MAKRTTNFGTIRNLPSGRYQARFTINGQRFPAPDTFGSRAAAVDWLDVERARVLTGSWAPLPNNATPPEAVTLADYARQWLDGRELSLRTRAHYERWSGNRFDCDLSPIHEGQTSQRL
ncbi:MAG: hypothetical protein ACTHXA_01750 [Gulosibacter sp.]|uniref:hypothetical protein n=1 Tax=Gulosibacter sp. TaxID=2817531 RepID=UPI003F8E9259